MKKREAAIVSAYTGILLGEFSEMHKYIEEIMERPIRTHELGCGLWDEIKTRSTNDFLSIVIESDTEGYQGEHEPKPSEPKRTWTDPKTGRVYELVKRPVQCGECIQLTQDIPKSAAKRGDVFKVRATSAFVKGEMHLYGSQIGYEMEWYKTFAFGESYYDVINGYQPEPELLQGAVVCYESCNRKVMIPFKKYTFLDGRVKMENGMVSSQFKSIDEWAQCNPKIKIARLIEN